MKTIIKSSALLFVFGLFSTGVFAADTAAKTDDEITVSSSATNDCSVEVSIDKTAYGNSMVTILDDGDNVVLRDALTKDATAIQKSYDFTGLDDGDYTIAVTSNDDVVKETVRVYSDENDQKTYIVK